MGKILHRLSEKDWDALTAVCAVCGPVRIKTYGNTWRCEVAYRQTRQAAKDRRVHRTKMPPKDRVCAVCQFQARSLCQMDLDHIDGDRDNNDPSNIQTLCSLCHRLKSYDVAAWGRYLRRSGRFSVEEIERQMKGAGLRKGQNLGGRPKGKPNRVSDVQAA